MKFQKNTSPEDFLDSNARPAHVASEMMVENQIHIEQLEIWARIGVSKAERAKPQRLVVNMTLWPSCSFHDLNDELTRTIDYAAVCDEVKNLVQEREDRLLETLADATALFLLKKFAVQKVRIEFRKFILRNAAYTAVTVTRGAAIG